MTVEKSTAFEDARTALRCAIWKRHRRRVVGNEWVYRSPGGDPPENLGCKKQAWRATLRVAVESLSGWQYTLPQPSLDDAESVLGENFNSSVSWLFDAMTTYRPMGVTTICDDGRLE